MTERIKSILGAAFVGGLIAYFGYNSLLVPALETSPSGEALLGRPWDLVVYVVLLILIFDWAVQKIGNTYLTAMVFAVPQILAVDVFYVLNGTRAAYPAVLSAGILLAVFLGIAFAYDALADGDSDGGDDSEEPTTAEAPSWGGDTSSDSGDDAEESSDAGNEGDSDEDSRDSDDQGY
jgi:hypothetical protein